MLDTEEVNVWSELKGLISIPAMTEHCLSTVSLMIEQGPWKLLSPAPLSMENRTLDCKVLGS